MELTVPIVVIDGDVGSLHRRRSSSAEAAMGWSQRRRIWQSLSMTINVNGGGGGIDPMVALPCIDGTDPTFFGKPVFVDKGRCQWRRQWDGADGSDHRH